MHEDCFKNKQIRRKYSVTSCDWDLNPELLHMELAFDHLLNIDYYTWCFFFCACWERIR